MQPTTERNGSVPLLDRALGSLPLYAQVAAQLSQDIAQGKYEPGDQLPSEPVLSKELGVARATITKAFEAMQAEGLIERWQGKGTFVSQAPSRHGLSDLSSFSSVTSASGAAPTQRLVAHRHLAEADDADQLAAVFPVPTELLELERVRLSDGSPVGFHRILLPAGIAKSAGLEDLDAVAEPTFSLYAALTLAGHAPASAEQSLMAVPCPSAIAKRLGTEAGQPMMRARRFTYDHTGLLIEAVDAHYVGSLYEYHTTLSAAGHSTKKGQINEDPGKGSDRHRDRRHIVGERLRRHSAAG